MNAMIQSARLSARLSNARNRRDNEFLPAALEVLETPPSPIAMGLLVLICALALSCLLWAYAGRIDIIAAAQGKVQPVGRIKVIQPLTAAKVLALHIRNGDRVAADQLLVELDRSAEEADEAQLAQVLVARQAEVIRRQAVIAAVESRNLGEVPKIAWHNNVPRQIAAREQLVLTRDVAELAANIASFEAQKQQKQAERDRLQATSAVQEELIANLNERVEMRVTLLDRNVGTKSGLIDAREVLLYQRTTLAIQRGMYEEAGAAMRVIDRDIAKMVDRFLSDNAQKLANASRDADEAARKLQKARVLTAHLLLRSPISGIVQGLTVTGPGQVVLPSEEIMRIIPDTGQLEIECYLPNKDIGFVKVGQEATLKIESFPFTRFGTISARVTRIASDAIPEPDAQQIEADPTKASRNKPAAGAQHTQNLVYAVTLIADRNGMRADGVDIALAPGMAVTAEIKTGSRRILEYVFSPLVSAASEALHER